jgi:ankyrin repeat protein
LASTCRREGPLKSRLRLLDANVDVNATEGSYSLNIEPKADFDAITGRGYKGRTALQAAAKGGHLEVVQMLLDAGARVNAPAAKSGWGQTALQAVTKYNHFEIVALLKSSGAYN